MFPLKKSSISDLKPPAYLADSSQGTDSKSPIVSLAVTCLASSSVIGGGNNLCGNICKSLRVQIIITLFFSVELQNHLQSKSFLQCYIPGH